MKCNEAFDMIFNGGEAVLPSREYSKDYRLHFNEDGVLCVPRVEHTKSAPVLHKADLKRDDWIVEKDGVVYEECPNKRVDDLTKVIPEYSDACSRINEQGKPIMPIIADQVNEDWLEKKMLCFMKRVYIAGGIERCDKKVDGSITEVITPDLEDVLIFNCENEDCHFCCSEESECEVCFPDVSKEDKAQGAIDQPRKKVTVKHMDDLLQKIRGIAYKRGALRQAWLDADEMDYVNDFQQKLEYLVSLQETKCLLNK